MNVIPWYSVDILTRNIRVYVFIFISLPLVWNLSVVEPPSLPGTSQDTHQEIDDGNVEVMMFLM